jgi:hypothetical protein
MVLILIVNHARTLAHRRDEGIFRGSPDLEDEAVSGARSNGGFMVNAR